MADFFEGIPQATAMKLRERYNEMTALKEQRMSILEHFATSSAEELLERISAGEVDEKSANEAYNVVIAINNEIEAIREECKEIMKKG